MRITRLVSIVLLLAPLPAYGQTPKHGGILNAMPAEDLPAGFAIHETSTAANLTAVGLDDPDAFFYENYKCGSTRNYSAYCNPEVDDLIERQSRKIDLKKRLALVTQIQQRLEADVAKPILGWRFGNFVQWPHVKNLVPHHVIYNYARMQEVWLDR